MRFAVADEAAALRDASDALLREAATPALIRSAWQPRQLAEVPGIAPRASAAEVPGIAQRTSAAEVPGVAPRASTAGVPGVAPRTSTAEVPGVAPRASTAGVPGVAPRAGTAEIRRVWRGLADIGLTGALVAAESGGLGLDENALPPVLTRIGYSGLPVPAAETVAVAAPLLEAAGHHALPDVLSGAALVTANLDATAAAGLLVPFLEMADYVLLRADGEVRLYERGEVDASPARAVDGARQLARLHARPAGGATLATPAAAAAAWQHGVLGTAAVLVGLAERMLSMTVEYVASRHQFGVPVGSFQAVKHQLADAYVAVEFARPALLAAGWAQAAGAADAAEQTSVAKVLASDAASVVARAAIQCHGAIGYTTEYDLHLFAKRAWALAASWGSAVWHRRHLAAAMGLHKGEGESGG